MPDEWLTIRECAQRLGRKERTLRRYVAMLAAVDVRARPKLPTLVRIGALEALLTGTPPIVPELPQTATDDHAEPTMAEPDNEALLSQLRSEVDFLRGQIQTMNVAEGEMRRLMMADKQELLELRQKLSITAQAEPEEVIPWWQFWKRWRRNES